MNKPLRPQSLTGWPGALLFAAAVAAVAVLAVACGGDDEEDALGESLEVTVTEEGVTPDDLRLNAPDRYDLVVQNDSTQSCTFSFGGLLRSLEVPAGESQSMSFVAVDAGEDGQIEIGCDDGRTTTATVETPGG